ncbi:MAG: hypothetical protein R6U63_03260 [Longimicrobiales bacterium]
MARVTGAVLLAGLACVGSAGEAADTATGAGQLARIGQGTAIIQLGQ